MNKAHLRLVTAPAENYSLSEEDRSGVTWLVARNYNIRFTATLSLPKEAIALRGVFLCIENAMLPVSNDEVLGYAHGVVSIYNAENTEVFTGPFLKPAVGMRWANGNIADHWTEVVGSWSGAKDFAGRLLQVSLQGKWQQIDGKQMLVEEGDVVLI